MDTHLPEYELYAIRYAERDARRSDHFIGGDPHDGPMPMDYFVWVAIAPHHTVVIDTGFTAEIAAARKRRFLRCPIEALSLLGVDGGAVKDVVLTHMHYDHVGNFHRLPSAQFHLQEVELHYTTGRHMRHPFLARSFRGSKTWSGSCGPATPPMSPPCCRSSTGCALVLASAASASSPTAA